MTGDDFAAFAKALGAVAVTLAEPLTSARIEAYFSALADLPLEAVQGACARACREATWFPKPVELRGLCGRSAPDVGLVEAMLVEHLRVAGNWRKLPESPFLRLVVERLGGLRAAQDMPAAQRVFAIGKVLPGVIAAATLRELPMPSEADEAQVSLAAHAMAQRAIAAAGTRDALYLEPESVPIERGPRRGMGALETSLRLVVPKRGSNDDGCP